MVAEIVFAAGCFWGVEKHFESINGVIDVRSGYTGGNYPNPTYHQVLNKRWVNNDKSVTNHTEAVIVKFDPKIVNAKELMKSFWELHDPTQVNRQGNDIGNNYRSAIFYTNENQRKIAYETKAAYQTLLKEHGFGQIVTQIKPLEKFYDAEAYHQDYLKKNPNGYCPNHSTGVKFKDEIKNSEALKNPAADPITPLGGKEIIIVTSPDYCPYCEKLEKEVTDRYNGTIPLRTVYKEQLKDFDIKTKLFATPTVLFIENGKEILYHRGYLPPESFYELLGAFKLGKDSKAYEIAFNKSTESRYCKQYDIFKDTPDGVFIDKVSGDILFDTRDRFNSKSGWLSFYKAVDDSTIEKPDYSYGMVRTEVLAKKSGIHLGHVFERPDGKRRFCINANVLEFVPREK
eukprot:Anaeramoba_ignava/a608697_105.p1 GENE.a608697_105~~a608697_105.p1  ORF type:complete len:401 (+),score=-4.76 a608697_105:207-1409(+)